MRTGPWHRVGKGRARPLAAVAVALGTVGGTLAAVAGAVTGSPTAAFADTGVVNYTCSSPMGNLAIPMDVFGSVPSLVTVGQSFSISGYYVQATISASLATTLASEGVHSLSGTTGAVVDAANASPSTLTPSGLTWSTTITSGTQDVFDIPNSGTLAVGPFTATSPSASPEFTSGTLTTLITTGFGDTTSVCDPPSPAPVIASSAAFSLTSTPSASSIVAGDPTGVSDVATLSGNTADGAPTGSVAFSLYQCPSGSPTCTSTTGTQVGTTDDVSLPGGASDTATVSSSVFPTPTSTGGYCFDASYSGGNYPAADDGGTGECFTVTPAVTCQASSSCTGSVSSSGSTVTVTGTSSTAGQIYLQVGQATLAACPPGYNTTAPFTTLQEGTFTSSAPLTVTDDVPDPTVKHFGVCFETLDGHTFTDAQKQSVQTGLLPKCKRSNPVAPCIESAHEVLGDVDATLLVPANDPRFHGGGPAPVVSSISPSAALPEGVITIRGLYLAKATVTFGTVAAKAKASASKIVVTVPSVAAGAEPITIKTATGSIVVHTFKVT